jgi:hypothetical protein
MMTKSTDKAGTDLGHQASVGEHSPKSNSRSDPLVHRLGSGISVIMMDAGIPRGTPEVSVASRAM